VLLIAVALLTSAVAEATPISGLPALVQQVSSSVVTIIAVKRLAATGDQPARMVVVTGSGFAITSDGGVLTNAHVVEDGVYISVMTADGKSYEADNGNGWVDSVSDLAVLHIPTTLKPVKWADTNSDPVGDSVFAIGAPYGVHFPGSVSAGVVSGLARPLDVDYPFIQTDAPVNPGNSGGPLFNARGEVVGVIARRIPGADGMGFAIPGDVATKVANQLIAIKGPIQRSWLGLQFAPGLDVDLLPSSANPVVTGVDENGPAAQAGVQAGDTLIRLDTTDVIHMEEVSAFLDSHRPGDGITATFVRGDKDQRQVTIRLGVRPARARLLREATGLWLNPTAAQAARAQSYGKLFDGLTAEEFLAPWTALAGDSQAVLVTPYLKAAATGFTPQVSLPALPTHTLAVQIDLAAHWQLGDAPAAEWWDSDGTISGTSVTRVGGAPAGYQRVIVSVPTDYISGTGTVIIILHLAGGADRRFTFGLDGLH
jgi:serine protease Do